MITIGRAFGLTQIQNANDLFVPVRFRCRQCRRRVRAIMLDAVAIDCAAGRIVCAKCDPDVWVRAAAALGAEHRAKAPLYVNIILSLKLQP